MVLSLLVLLLLLVFELNLLFLNEIVIDVSLLLIDFNKFFYFFDIWLGEEFIVVIDGGISYLFNSGIENIVFSIVLSKKVIDFKRWG